MLTRRKWGDTDPVSGAIDAIAQRAADGLSSAIRRARMLTREHGALSRLGLDIILSAQREILEAAAYDELAGIPRVASGEWWLAPAVSVPAGGDPVHVLAAKDRVVVVEIHAYWPEHQRVSDHKARAMLGLCASEDLEASAVASVADSQTAVRWARSAFGRPVALTPTRRLAETTLAALQAAPAFDPQADPQLSRVLLHAVRRARQRSAAIAHFAAGLDSSGWVIAQGVRLPGLANAMDALVVGTSGIYVCQAAGLEPARAAALAVKSARHLARISRGLDADITPVVLCEAGLSVHQLRVSGDSAAWALPVDEAASRISETGRAGPHGRHLRRVRRPAPGWEYRSAFDGSSWGCEIRYDLSRHERPAPADLACADRKLDRASTRWP